MPLVVGITLFIVLLGFLIILQIVEPIIKISKEAKLIAQGDFQREIELAREDEIGELGMALNQMTRRIKDNVVELTNFSKQTESLNLEINRRILTLSSLVEISNLIAQNADLQLILKYGLERSLEFSRMTFGCLILKEQQGGEFKIHHKIIKDDDEGRDVKDSPIKLGRGLLGKTILKQELTVIDKDAARSEDVSEFKTSFSLNSAVLAPITSKGNVFGLLVIGNKDPQYVCSAVEKEIYYLVAKQIAIAITNELLKKEIEKLEVTDHLTGLFNNTFTRKRLSEEIKRATSLQQPCSFVLFSLDRFKELNETFGHIAAENILIKIGNIFKESISKEDKAARFGDHEFALILPGKNKRESISVSEFIRKNIEHAFSKEEDARKRLTCSGAITENPIDGVTAEELILKSGVLLAEAVQQGGNKIAY
ncbi:MAG: hypothetical protein A2Z88_06595 [Omnitrophica WOR_2 bacterium GWA2_47_8]|nr:MAG: hypothetical protein A2Z88_06595 [Omnitrophica WOR_2 bacterium GWA2_47_8]